MNDYVKINKNIFKKSKNFRLFIIFNVVLYTFIIGSVFAYTCCYSLIDNAINDEYNKIINISVNNNYDEFEKFYNDNYDKFNDKVIDVYVDDIILLGEHFDIVNSDEDFDIYNLGIRISNKYINNDLKDILGIKDFSVEYLLDDDNVIYCNQLFSKELLKNGYSGMISLSVKNYKDLDNILTELDDRDFDANLNKGINDNIVIYSKAQDILFIIIILVILLTIFVTIFQLIQLFYEQRKNLFIYNVVGVNKHSIFLIYIWPILIYALISYFLIMLVFYIIGNLFMFGFNNMIFWINNIVILAIILTITLAQIFIQVINIRKGV